MEKRNPEKVVVFVYSIYAVVLMFAAVMIGWPTWINAVALIGILTVWLVYLRALRDYRFRSLLYSAVALATFALYNTLESSFAGILTTYCALVVALSILNVPEIAVPEYIFSTLLIIYHGIFRDTIPVATTHEKILSAAQILAVFMVIGITHHLIKRRQEKDRHTEEVIKELKAAEQSKLDFLAHVSRQIERPVQNITDISTVSLQQDQPANVMEEIQRIRLEGRNLLATISDVLDFSEMESGRMELEEKTYHPSSAINDTISMACAAMGTKNLELIIDCDADMPSVLLGDEQKLRRVILCMVNNAVKYTESGCITLVMSARPEEYGINLCIKVKDTGIGIAAEDQERLFDRFARAETAGNRQEDGIGIGLAISKRIISKMNGFISVRSEPGKGSEFQFVVPQKVVDERPMAAVRHAEDIKVIVYINTEKASMAAFRDDYMNSIRHMMEGLELHYHVCRNLEEFKRRCGREVFTHILLAQDEYMEDREYFDRLSRQMELMVIQEHQESRAVGENVKVIEKPFYVLSLAAVLNGIDAVQPKRNPEDVEIKQHAVAKRSNIDRNIGLHHMGGNPEHYEAILQAYLSEGHEKIPVIREQFQSEDWDNYIIYAHAVKSNSFGIGAEALGEMAKALEIAGKEGNLSYIRDHHEEMMRLYEEVLAEIDGESHSLSEEGRDRP